MQKLKMAFCGFVGVIAAFLLMGVLGTLLFSCDTELEAKYIKASGWELEDGQFFNEYLPIYEEKIKELKAKFSIECEYIKEKRHGAGDDQVTFYLYSDTFTVEIVFVDREIYGDYGISLFYYGESGDDLDDYSKQKPLVDFINELTRFVAYDTKSDENENHLEKLYVECVKQNFTGDSYTYHFDNFVGNVGYCVACKWDGGGYYYKMQRDRSVIIPANTFSFEGILRAQD